MLAWLLMVAIVLAGAATNAGLLLRGSGGAPTAPTIVDIQPHTASVPASVASGTIVTTYTCVMSDNSTCPPPGSGYVWTMSTQPSFLSLNLTTGVLTTNRALTSTDACTPAQDSCTYTVTIGPPPPSQVSSISPTSLTILDNVALGTAYQFSCTMSDASPCTNKSWSYANIPTFLTPTINSTGVVLTTNVAPPLTHASGTLSVSAQ